ncbi:GNAT family N-acetyltransferase [Cohnella lubricantis]|uniref:GNAT family N-acetyltransferase n=1 Tax=Cohnella lubricantis TaxID=2163172 RepID=A0A841T590_9BACL|nr:GNAT family N-acetyltransferase [Cohnella lubricantis]MBB6676703.1 GNAT family N-acetyltransferase [Cohnella lubricantis]MBP2117749.1 RimJ/RimL family protein N-acetyltransferase [Cohnella lubricantis]
MAETGKNPILLDIPESFESERLLIRAPQWGDGAAVNEAIRESLDELKPWMPWAQQAPTVEESELNLREARLRYLERSDLRLQLISKSTGQFIGGSGLHRIDWQSRKFEIGYWVRTSCAGQGYITEAAKAIANFAATVLEANRIEIRCDAKNHRSARVAERLGFTLEGVLRDEAIGTDGMLRSTKVFSIVRGIEF